MKKYVSLLICFILICNTLWGCSGNVGTSSSKINIVCTIYPQYDWVMNLIGDNADKYNVTLLVDNGTDLHSYQPSARDIVTIKSCDMLIYLGGTSDAWLMELLSGSVNKDMIMINMMDTIGDMAKAEEVVEGMEEEHHHDHEHTEECDHSSHEDSTEYDEHIWLSLRNAKTICESISSALCKLDSDSSDIYNSALANYSSNLDSLDKQYSDAIASATRNTLLFGDRFPFRYMTEDYNLEYYAAFAGCSADTEASFQTIIFLSNKMDSLTLPGVCVTESTDRSLAKTIIENSTGKKDKIFVFNSMQSITSKDIEGGSTYLAIMEDNLSVLKEALN